MGTVQKCPECNVVICGHAFAAMQKSYPYNRHCEREELHESHEYEIGIGIAFWCDGAERKAS